jgi:membrane-bound serine protease (ClpP class)
LLLGLRWSAGKPGRQLTSSTGQECTVVRAAAGVASATDAIRAERGPRLAAALLLVTVALAWLVGFPGAATAQGSTVLVTRVEGTITPVIADHLVDGVAVAERDGRAAYLVELDTPGGLDTSMREIIKAFLGADVPVVVYVTPSGARAASAGALITFAANLAAMAPGTTIGAATPVDLQGGEISDKVINDAAAFAETVAAQRGRNTRFAIDTVREGRAVPAAEALRLDAVDLLAASRAELLEKIDGRSVQVANGNTVTLRTAGATPVEQDFGLFRRLLQLLADPNLAFLFLSLGTLAVIYELANPGVGFGGIAGAIFLLLGFFALSVLPINLVGVLLLALAAALFVTELFVPGVGVFAAGGTVALVLGGLFLFDGEVRIDPAVLIPVALVVGGGSVLAGRLAWRARRTPSITGRAGLIGRQVTLRTADGATGQVLLDGAWWTVRSRGAPLAPGQRVRVVDLDGLDLIVDPEEGTL